LPSALSGSATRHLGLLRAIVGADVATVRAALCEPATDLIAFLSFVHVHHLGAFTYWAIRQLGLANDIPPRTDVVMRASSLVERRRTERQLAQLRELADLCERAGVAVLFMKGPLFAQRFYASLDARGFSDLDLLLRAPSDLDRLEAVLVAAGYRPAFRVLGTRRMSRWFAHHFEYVRQDLPLDVHWALQRHVSFAVDYEAVWSTASEVALAGRTYRATSAEYELVLQILGVVTDLQVGQLTLRPLVDVHRILRAMDSTSNWDVFFAARRRERILRPCLYVLALVLDLLDCGRQFANLQSRVAAELSVLPSLEPARRAVLESRKLDLRQKLLSFRLYETPLPAAVAWWVVSLPFRVAVYAGSPAPRGAGERSPDQA
jgi:Uncharacterised nucleotidyltransferase